MTIKLFMDRYEAAKRSRSKEIRLSIAEADLLATDIVMLLSGNNKTEEILVKLDNLSKDIKKLSAKEDQTTIEIKGGTFS